MQPSHVADFEVVSGKRCRVATSKTLGLAYASTPSDSACQRALEILTQRSLRSESIIVSIHAHEVSVGKVVGASSPEGRYDIVVTWTHQVEEKHPLRASTLLNFFDDLLDEIHVGSKISPALIHARQTCTSGRFQREALTPEGGLPLKKIKPRTRYHAITAEDLDPDSIKRFPIMVIDVSI
eukprot:TRINITY_DN58740_c0_g1_i1.p1 TRINITY_DN58740_c0_g1~~TRINITY_DN58740_c0_g1_i1.p1  ORF type:complete len:203 (-),score=15.35 TRINITY_DN58740_c0_g1_i1:29-571(-)